VIGVEDRPGQRAPAVAGHGQRIDDEVGAHVQAVRITRTRTIKTKTTRETAFLTVWLPAGQAHPADLQDWARREWHIENRVHYIRDLTLRETPTKPAPATAPPSSLPCATPRSATTAATANPTSPAPPDAPTTDHTTSSRP
jgi:hypothetical protein